MRSVFGEGYAAGFLQATERKERLIRADDILFPRLDQAVTEVCVQFEISERPVAYVKRGPTNLFAGAYKNFYCIVVHENLYEALNDRQLKALVAHEIKHLFQGFNFLGPIGKHINEYDSDRASVNATDAETAVSAMARAQEVAKTVCKEQYGQPEGWVGKFCYTMANALLVLEHPTPWQRYEAMRRHQRENSIHRD